MACGCSTGLGLSHPRAGLLLAELSALGSLGLLWWLLEASPCPANLACLALAAVFPGSVYEHALFRCRWPSPAAWRSWPWRPAAAGPPPGRLLVDRGQVRDRLARPGRHLPQERRPPGPSAWRLWQVTGRPDRPPRDQFRLVTVIAVLGLAATLAASERTPLDLAVLVYTVLFWLAPLVAGGHLAQYRVHALLTPSVLLLRRLPAAVPAVLALLAAVVAWRMAGLFYHYMLI